MTTDVINKTSILLKITDPYYYPSMSFYCPKCGKRHSVEEVREAGCVCPVCKIEVLLV